MTVNRRTVGGGGCAVVRFSDHLYKILVKKRMQDWMEKFFVTFWNLIKTMPQQLRAVIKAKRGPTKY